jgi:hypothetical protein
VYNFLDHLDNLGNFTDIFYYTFCGELLALSKEIFYDGFLRRRRRSSSW